MRVVYLDGREGTLSAENSRNLYLRNRFSRQDWENLYQEMLRLGIIKFEEPFLSQYGADLISIQYVRKQIKSH